VTDNRQFVSRIFAELSTGNSRPLIEALGDDVSWTVIGQTPWSRTYRGKASVLKDLLSVLGTRLADRYRAHADRILVDGDYVVVQARGESTTKSGRPYNNEYCFVYRINDGRIVEVTEYLDTQLVVDALGGE
jgi:ketosteroid isomerase-like protein